MITRSGTTGSCHDEVSIRAQEAREKDQRKKAEIHDRRLNEIKVKLQDIGTAIRELDSIQSATEDALLSWLRGPVSVSFV